MNAARGSLQKGRSDWVSFFGVTLTGIATWIIVAVLCVIVGNILYQGWPNLSVRFLVSGVEQGMFNVEKSGVLPMIVGTASRVILMTIFVIPIGVITAI